LPGALGILVHSIVEALHQRDGDLRALFLGQRQRFFQDFQRPLRHTRIIPPVNLGKNTELGTQDRVPASTLK
jgi:hypothetical protein